MPTPSIRPAQRPAPRIEVDTPLVPRAVAEGVCEEAGVWLDQPLPRRWIRELTARANTIYAHNPRFRRKVRGPGNLGRDYLWMFARHWLSALLWEHRPQLHARLPSSYNIGHPLPPKPDMPPHWLNPKSGVDWKKYSQQKRKEKAGTRPDGIFRVTSANLQPVSSLSSLPALRPAAKAGRKTVRRIPPPTRPRPCPAPDCAFAAAAHFPFP